jgi:hypothetical protein
MFNFGIAHWAMVNEFVDVLGRYICYRRMVIRVLQAGHNKVVFSSGGLFRNRLSTRVERACLQFLEGLRPPRRHESPPHADEVAIAVALGHHIHRIGGADVVSRRRLCGGVFIVSRYSRTISSQVSLLVKRPHIARSVRKEIETRSDSCRRVTDRRARHGPERTKTNKAMMSL